MFFKLMLSTALQVYSRERYSHLLLQAGIIPSTQSQLQLDDNCNQVFQISKMHNTFFHRTSATHTPSRARQTSMAATMNQNVLLSTVTVSSLLSPNSPTSGSLLCNVLFSIFVSYTHTLFKFLRDITNLIKRSELLGLCIYIYIINAYVFVYVRLGMQRMLYF